MEADLCPGRQAEDREGVGAGCTLVCDRPAGEVDRRVAGVCDGDRLSHEVECGDLKTGEGGRRCGGGRNLDDAAVGGDDDRPVSVCPVYARPDCLKPVERLLIARRGLLPARSADDPVDRRLWAIGSFLPLFCPLGVALFWALARFGLLGSRFGAPPGILFAPVAAALGAGVWVWFRGYWKSIPGLFLAAAAGFAAFGLLTSPLSGPGLLEGLDDNRSFYREVAHQVRPQAEIVLCIKHIPALGFYLERVPWLYRVDNELVDGMEMEPDLPGIFRTATELNSALKSSPIRNYYAVLMKKHRAGLEKEGLRFGPDALAEDGELILLKLMAP